MKNYEGIEKAQNLAKKYTDKAYKEIHKLPDNPYKEILLEIVTMLLERSY